MNSINLSESTSVFRRDGYLFETIESDKLIKKLRLSTDSIKPILQCSIDDLIVTTKNFRIVLNRNISRCDLSIQLINIDFYLRNNIIEKIEVLAEDSLLYSIQYDKDVDIVVVREFYDSGLIGAENTYVYNPTTFSEFIKSIVNAKRNGYFGHYNNDKHGLSRQWYDNGKLFEQSFYQKGKRQGELIRWYKDGKVKEILTHTTEGDPLSLKVFYQNTIDGKECVREIRSYSKSKTNETNEKVEIFYMNGHLQERYFIISNGYRNGNTEIWDEKGNLLYLISYLNGNQHGLCLEYNGKDLNNPKVSIYKNNSYQIFQTMLFRINSLISNSLMTLSSSSSDRNSEIEELLSYKTE